MVHGEKNMKKSLIAAALAVVALSLASPAAAQEQPQVTAECEMQQTIEEMNQSQGDQPFMTCDFIMNQSQQQQQGQQGGGGLFG